QTPDRPRTEVLVLRLEVEIMNCTGQMLRSLQLALDERLVDDHLRRDVGQFTPLPSLHLLSDGFEVALHPINSNRDTVDEGERLRVFCEHGGEIAVNGHDGACSAVSRNQYSA